MSESDVVFMLVFAGTALALGLIAEANKKQDQRTPSPPISRQEEAKIHYRVDRRRLNEILDVLPEHSIHHPVLSPLVEQANRYAEDGDYLKAKGRVNKAHSYLVQNADKFGFIRPLNKIFLASDIPQDFDKDTIVESHAIHVDRPDYVVNPFKRTCTCDWMMNLNVEALEPCDVRRICRHQVYVLNQAGFYFESDSKASLEILNSPYRKEFYTLIRDGDVKCVVGFNNDFEWVQVIVLEPELKEKEYSFNLLDKRWAYGSSPRGSATKVKTAIRKAFTHR